MSREPILFVTGRQAETSLREFLPALASKVGFNYEIAVQGISMAALMHVKWMKRKLTIPDGMDRVFLSGWYNGDLSELTAQFGVLFELGPKDLFNLPEYFGQKGRERPTLEESINILSSLRVSSRRPPKAVIEHGYKPWL